MLIVSRPSCARPRETDCWFQIAWQINPHMRIGAADCTTASQQHAAFVAELRSAGASILELPFIHGAFDSVFVKDCAALRLDDDGGWRVLPATARFAQRATEPTVRATQLERAGVHLERALTVPFEGGDLVISGSTAIMGYGMRTDLRAAAGLERFLGIEVVPVRLRDPGLYHLDVALAMLSTGALVLCEEAFDAPSLRALARIHCAKTIAVDKAEAMRFSLNVVEVGGTIITGTDSPAMTAVWTSLGLQVRYTNLDQFQLAGGSAACLVARVHDVAGHSAKGVAA
jgi:N-dimethylarginine dimethylaminohydrolase